MNRISVLGDSNVYRNVTAERLAAKLSSHITLMNTTRLTTLEARLKDIKTDDIYIVVVSALGNIISDCGREADQDKMEDAIGGAVKGYVDLIAKGTQNKQKVVLSQPMYRSDPKWFADYLLFSKDLLKKECAKYPNMTVLPDYRVTGIDLIEDGVGYISRMKAGLDSLSILLAV